MSFRTTEKFTESIYEGSWSGRPTASSANTGLQITVTDYGIVRSRWISDGTNWRPLAGTVLLYSREASVASPIASITGNGTSQIITLPESLVIPAGMIPPNGQVQVQGWGRKGGVVATFTATVVLGTGNNTSDTALVAQTIPNANNAEWKIFGSAKFTSTTTYTSDGFMSPNNANSSVSQADRSTQINTAAAMYVNFIGNPSASDTWALNSYKVWLIA